MRHSASEKFEIIEWRNSRRRLTSTLAEHQPYLNGGKPSNERPSSKDAACIGRQSQPEPSNQMSQTLS
jgi:hypothetical protein